MFLAAAAVLAVCWRIAALPSKSSIPNGAGFAPEYSGIFAPAVLADNEGDFATIVPADDTPLSHIRVPHSARRRLQVARHSGVSKSSSKTRRSCPNDPWCIRREHNLKHYLRAFRRRLPRQDLRANTTAAIRERMKRASVLAKFVNTCEASKDWLVEWPHKVDVVVSDAHKLVYIDIVKAASSSIRARLRRVLKVDWSIDQPSTGGKNCSSGRVTTACLDGMTLLREGYTVFSFVRSPFQKYLSGIEQAKVQTKMRAQRANRSSSSHSSHSLALLAEPSSSILLPNAPTSALRLSRRHILKDQTSRWEQAITAPVTVPKQGELSWSPYMNEHLQSNMWRLTGMDKNGKPLRVDFVGQVEHFDTDWAALVQLLAARGHLSESETRDMMEPMSHFNSRTRRPAPVYKGFTERICNMPDIQWDLFCLRAANYTCG